MLALTNLILTRPLRIQSTRSAASAAQRIRARVDLRSEHLTRRRCILGDVSPERVHLAAIEPEDPDWLAPLVVGRLVSEPSRDPSGPMSHFEGCLRLSSGMRLLLPALMLLGLCFAGCSLVLLLASPSTSATFPLLLSIPVLGASLVALYSINDRVQDGANQLEQLLRESLEAPLLPADPLAGQAKPLAIVPPEKRATSNKPAAA